MKSNIFAGALFVFLFILDASHDPLTFNTALPFWGGFGLFCMTIFFRGVSISTKKQALRHYLVYGLITLPLLMMAVNRLFYFQGYFELPEGGRFDGKFIQTGAGPFGEMNQTSLNLSRKGPEESSPEHKGARGVSLYTYRKGRQRKQVNLEFKKSVLSEGVLFSLRKEEFGGTFTFSLKRSEEIPVEKHSFNFPLHSSKTVEFPLFGLDGTVKASFFSGGKQRETGGFKPEEMEVMLTYRDELPVKLRRGDYLIANNRVLTLADITRWDGVVVTELPFPQLIIFESLLSRIFHLPVGQVKK